MGISYSRTPPFRPSQSLVVAGASASGVPSEQDSISSPSPSHTQDWAHRTLPTCAGSRQQGLAETRSRHGLGALKGDIQGTAVSTREARPGSRTSQDLSL